MREKGKNIWGKMLVCGLIVLFIGTSAGLSAQRQQPTSMIYWSGSYYTTITQPPETPQFNGPLVGRVGVMYNFTIAITDPEANQFFFLIDWGDWNTTGWIGPFDSGEEVELSHAWNQVGTFLIQVKAKDMQGTESTTVHCTIQIVKLRKSFVLGVFHNQSETVDLRIIDMPFAVVIPSMTIMNFGVPVVIAKEYRFGFLSSSFICGIFDATILHRWR
jgi:hypothetical protein